LTFRSEEKLSFAVGIKKSNCGPGKKSKGRKEILAVEDKFHFWWIFSETAKSAKISS